jgi:hypothetical protein
MLLVLRFLTDICGSPCLATGGGTPSDIYDQASSSTRFRV